MTEISFWPGGDLSSLVSSSRRDGLSAIITSKQNLISTLSFVCEVVLCKFSSKPWRERPPSMSNPTTRSPTWRPKFRQTPLFFCVFWNLTHKLQNYLPSGFSPEQMNSFFMNNFLHSQKKLVQFKLVSYRGTRHKLYVDKLLFSIALTYFLTTSTGVNDSGRFQQRTQIYIRASNWL